MHYNLTFRSSKLVKKQKSGAKAKAFAKKVIIPNCIIPSR